jgi:FtsP/CotA-like multicopper oxidase with cupredoxin domain
MLGQNLKYGRLTRRQALVVGGGALAGAAIAGPILAPDRYQAGASNGGQTREYFIAAEEVDWDYAPSGKDLITGEPFSEAAQVFTEPGPNRIGHVYRKALYHAFTDDTFSTRAAADPRWEHLGILGPVIHAEVGDTIVVHFKNNTTRPTTMHPHGVFYDKDSEGAGYADESGDSDHADDAVESGATYTYTWKVPERAGPAMHDPSSIVWMYHSHVDEPADTYAGLSGPIIITRAGMAKPDGSPTDVDREFVLLFEVMDENASRYITDNVAYHIHPEGDSDEHQDFDDEFIESNLMHGINGYVYGNLPGLTMRVGERVRWYVMGMGTEVDLHTPHWHGNTLTMMGMRTDMVELLPMSMKTLDMTPGAVGTWLLHCHVNDHIVAGMQALYTVTE